MASHAPGIVSRGVVKLIERRGKAEDINVCHRHLLVVERICRLFDITVDRLEPVPSFTVKGHCYHDALSAIRAGVQNQVG